MERASQAKGVATVAVATDDERVATAVKAFGGRVIMTPEACRSGSDRVALAVESLSLGGDELVVNVQGDQPLLPLGGAGAVRRASVGRAGAGHVHPRWWP